VRKIKVLPDQIINLIAAGEVVERPASVVKELVENSLDASASRIIIETFGAGRDLIRVSDNGTGISKDELSLALRRHATSKLSNLDQLWRLQSFGFRGEALASIAEISKVELISKVASADTGYALTVEGGKTVAPIRAVGTAVGTRISVEDLFYNTPARAKYLKSQSGENRQIIKVVQDIALANPQVSFTLIVEGQTRIKTPGTGGPLGAAAAIFGLEFAAKLVEINAENAFGKVNGWLGEVGHYASTRSQQVFSVNRRVFQHAPFVFAVENAHKGLLPVRRFPVFAIDITIDASAVDVNVHPAKLEVRFQHEAEIRSLLYHAVKEALENKSQKQPANRLSNSTVATSELPRYQEQGALPVVYPLQDPRPTPPPTVTVVREPISDEQFSYFGQLNDTYLIWEHQGDLVLLDQHAAHERILFEEILAALSKGHLNQQELLFPQVLHLAANEIETVWSCKEALERLGFTLEDFGGNCLLLRALPILLAGTPAEADLRATITELAAVFEASPDKEGAVQDYYWRAAQIAACHGAIRAGQKLDVHQAKKLIVDWLALGIPTCPHGRPIVHRFNQEGLAKLFLRS